MNVKSSVLSILGLLVSALVAALPYWITAPGISENWLDFSPYHFVLALTGVVLVGLPIGLLVLLFLRRTRRLTAINLFLAAVSSAVFLSIALIVLFGTFSIIFVPGILLAAICMALWSSKFVLPHNNNFNGGQ
ncbi:MAG: hypothetical protein AAF067_09985 [Pseudomonadota bacterium]